MTGPNLETLWNSLPAGSQKQGDEIISAVAKITDAMPTLTTVSALSAVLYARATERELDEVSRSALSVIVYELCRSVLHANKISDDRIRQLVSERNGA